MESVEKIWKKKHKPFYRVHRVLDRGTRQTPSLPCAQGQAHGKGTSLLCVTLDTRQIMTSVRCRQEAWRQKKVRRVPDSGTRQTLMAVRPCDGRASCLTAESRARHVIHVRRVPAVWHTAKSAVRRVFDVCRVFSCRRTANHLFAMCPKKWTRQRFWHTAN